MEHQKSLIPDGIQFGHQVLVVPGIASGFIHSGRIGSGSRTRPYRWIRRGEAIATFNIEGSYYEGLLARLFNTKLHSVEIPSPASGLVLHSTLGDDLSGSLDRFETAEHPPIAAFSILLPDDEPAPEGSGYLYGQFCNFVSSFQHYYLRPSRYWSQGAFDPEDFRSLVDLQRTRSARVFNALPNWADYLDEARTRHPELRPYLRHLR